jgi:hypothetical protein
MVVEHRAQEIKWEMITKFVQENMKGRGNLENWSQISYVQEEMSHEEKGCDDAHSIHLAQAWEFCRALGNTLMNHLVSSNAVSFLIVWGSDSFAKINMFHVITQLNNNK